MTAKINKRTKIHEGRVFTLTRENITLENGVTTDLDVLRHPGASAILPMPDAETLVLIRQYRPAIGSYIWEIPAGTLELGEAPLACAKRELSEETGFSGNTWQKLGEITPLPGYSDERIHIFLATDLRAAEQNLDSDEILKVREIPFTQAKEMIHKGDIQDSKTIAGIFLAAHWLDRQEDVS
jgi:ADP-ribose pyrophosphatase